MSSSLSIGIIGAGIGRQHVRGYSQLPKAHIKALCDVHLERAQALADEFQLPDVQLHTDYHEMLAEENLDAVSVCVPNALHKQVVLDCLRAGVNVLCEKPIAMSAEEAQEIADATQASGKICMVSHVLRFRDDAQELKHRAASVGDIYYVRTMARRSRGIPKWGGWFTQGKLAGGGPLIDTGVHILDLAWWLSGQPNPVSAAAVTHAAFGPTKQRLGSGGAANEDGVFDVEDLAAGFVRFDNGLSIHFEASWAIAAEKDERYCYLHGTQGALLWDDNARVVTADDEVHPLGLGGGDAWRNEVAEFLACITDGRQPDPDAKQGVVIMKILDALYESAKTGREIAIR